MSDQAISTARVRSLQRSAHRVFKSDRRPACPACPALLAVLALLPAVACAPAAPPPPGPGPDVGALFGGPEIAPDAGGSPIPADTTSRDARADAGADANIDSPLPPCQSDGDCGYDPTSGECGVDPRWNKQPPLVDQGLVCYCDAPSRACALLRVEPVPCEGEASCALRLDPRPHPVRASATHPYKKPQRCTPPRPGAPRKTDLYTTCERTNICTMHTRECALP